jgi:hypothetical protein
VSPIAWIAVAVGVAILLLILDRLALAAERRGWIYYRHTRAAPGTTANALQTVMAIWDPNARHAADERRTMDLDDAGDEGGDDPLGEAIRRAVDGPRIPDHLPDDYPPRS